MRGKLCGNPRRLPKLWTAFYALIIAGSIGLKITAYFSARVNDAAFTDAYMLVQSNHPTARSDFGVYLIGRDLYYFKQPYDLNDTKPKFFLAAFPTNVLDILGNRHGLGFENLDFYFNEAYGYITDGVCIVKVRLPSFEIEKNETGQFG